jgi:hypothetical protein
MDLKQFRKRLGELERESAAEAANTASHHVVDCERCANCVFCERCERCYRCAYCRNCRNSTNLTHCASCVASHHLANSVECTSCTSSAFLVLCRDLSECNYCFGCVGLSRVDFHVLNEPYDRSAYFAITKELGLALHLPRP